MKQIPAGLDTGIFKGRRVDHVTFAEFSIFIGFDPRNPFGLDDRISIRIEHAYEHSVPGSPVERGAVQSRIAGSGLMNLCGRSVVESDPNCLHLTFDDGQELLLICGTGPYESYAVQHGDAEYVV